MKTNYKIKLDGFTIIEVTLVLGIAGLIFLMMFIALPALQRQERDTEREEDITHLLTEIKHYQTNNRGALPGLVDVEENPISYNSSSEIKPISWTGFYRDYLGGSFVDPGGDSYELYILECNNNITGGICDGKVAEVVNNLNNKRFEELNRVIYIVKQATCAGSESKGVVASKNMRKVAALYKKENSGVYCANT